MKPLGLRQVLLVAAVALLVAAEAQPNVQIEFIADTPALEPAARAYREIWAEHGQSIVAALEAHTCLRFTELSVSALVADAGSHSGGPAHPMRLRASYFHDVKRSTLVHELGHRLLWQLAERLDDVDGHQTLYLVLDRVWADVWGEEFAADRVRGESDWRARYDYAAAWAWARSLPAEERARLWNRLLVMNGFANGCNDSAQRAG